MPPVYVTGEIVAAGVYDDDVARLAILIDRAHLENLQIAGEPETSAFLYLDGESYLTVIRFTGRFAMICPDLVDDNGDSRRLTDVLPPSWQEQPCLELWITAGDTHPIIGIGRQSK